MMFFVCILLAGMSTAFSSVPTASVGPNSVLHIELSETIKDKPVPEPLAAINPLAAYTPSLSLVDVLSAIEMAADDPRIEGIYLQPSVLSMGMATMEEIRGALLEFRDSGKFILGYADAYTQAGYYLASVADSVYVHPEGGVEWRGMAATSLYFRGLLDRLEVVPEIYRVGEFKSAVEPFMNRGMSPENRRQTEALLGSIWDDITEGVAESRGLEASDLQLYATRLAVATPRRAEELGLIDGTRYHDQILAALAEKSGSADGEPALVPLADYINAPAYGGTGRASRNQVALIYAEGDIMDGGESDAGIIAADALAEKLARVRQDDRVDAVVLRVNSPGGSALAADVIWREMSLVQQAKPLVVSMGDYAASGGYYIACPADVILADKYTLTGSIGVFGMTFNLETALRDKLGVTADVVRTNPSGDLGSPFRPTTSAERTFIQNSVERVYDTFVGHVAEGRNLSRQEVLRVAGGRVWSGIDAFHAGLVDGHGGIGDAIELAADRAGIADDYRIVVPEDPLDQWTQLLNTLFTARAASKTSAAERALLDQYRSLTRVLNQQGVQARMPYTLQIQ
jgi:protease-4